MRSQLYNSPHQGGGLHHPSPICDLIFAGSGADCVRPFAKHDTSCGAYLRYVDDFALFADSRRQLWSWKAAIIERLAALRLVIHVSRAQVLPVDDGIPWLGFVVYPTHRLVKARKVRSAHRRLRTRLRPIMRAKSASPRWMPAFRTGSPMSATPTAGDCAGMSSTPSSSAPPNTAARSRRGGRGMAKKSKRRWRAACQWSGLSDGRHTPLETRRRSSGSSD
jgi:hypothetical protein